MPGAEEFLRLSKELKETAPAHRRELHAQLRRATRPLIRETRREAIRQLPRRGGLNRRYAKNKQVVKVLTGALTAGVRIVMPRADSRSIEQGRIRHPVFGRRDRKWVGQQVSGTWWDETLEAGAPTVRRHLDDVVDTMRRRLTGE